MCVILLKQFYTLVEYAIAIFHEARAFTFSSIPLKPAVGGYNFLHTLLLRLGYVLDYVSIVFQGFIYLFISILQW